MNEIRTAADDLLDAIGDLYGCGDIRFKYELEDARAEAVKARAALLAENESLLAALRERNQAAFELEIKLTADRARLREALENIGREDRLLSPSTLRRLAREALDA